MLSFSAYLIMNPVEYDFDILDSFSFDCIRDLDEDREIMVVSQTLLDLERLLEHHPLFKVDVNEHSHSLAAGGDVIIVHCLSHNETFNDDSIGQELRKFFEEHDNQMFIVSTYGYYDFLTPIKNVFFVPLHSIHYRQSNELMSYDDVCDLAESRHYARDATFRILEQQNAAICINYRNHQILHRLIREELNMECDFRLENCHYFHPLNVKLTDGVSVDDDMKRHFLRVDIRI